MFAGIDRASRSNRSIATYLDSSDERRDSYGDQKRPAKWAPSNRTTLGVGLVDKTDGYTLRCSGQGSRLKVLQKLVLPLLQELSLSFLSSPSSSASCGNFQMKMDGNTCKAPVSITLMAEFFKAMNNPNGFRLRSRKDRKGRSWRSRLGGASTSGVDLFRFIGLENPRV